MGFSTKWKSLTRFPLQQNFCALFRCAKKAPLFAEQKVGGNFSKAQASVEQLIVIALALAVVSATIYVAVNYLADGIKISQGQDAVERLAAAANNVYALGPGSKEYVAVYMPNDLLAMDTSGKRILFTMGTNNGGTSDIFAYTHADLINSLPTNSGKHKVLVEYLSSGKVRLGEAGLSCSPPSMNKSFNDGDMDSGTITMTNDAEFEITGITASMSGSALLASAASGTATLAPGEQGTITVDFHIPSGQPTGIYSATVSADSGNDGSCITQVTMDITGQSNCQALCGTEGYPDGACSASASSCISAAGDHLPGFDYSCSDPTPSCCCLPTVDAWGPLATSISHTPENATSATPITIHATCNGSATGGHYISSAVAQIDGGAFAAMGADDGAFSASSEEAVSLDVGNLSSGHHVAGIRCNDTANNTGPLAYYHFNVSISRSANNSGPVIIAMEHSDPYPTTLVNITENATASEVDLGDNNIASCTMKVDNGDWFSVPAQDGAYDSPTESFSYNIGQMASGMHQVAAYCTDVLNITGPTRNDTFGVSASDVMLVMDRSGSMGDASDNSTRTTTSSSFALIKSITVYGKNGDDANLSASIKSSSSSCLVSFEARVGGAVIASGNTISTSYVKMTELVNISAYTIPFTVSLYMKRNASSCTASNSNFSLEQDPNKLESSQVAAKAFVDLMDNSTQVGLVYYSTSATTSRQLAPMSSANKAALKAAIDAITASGNTCIECGLDNAVDELVSARGRYPEAVRIVVLLTDGQGNVGDSVDGAVYARNNNATAYAVGFGDDVDDTELTNIALLTYGQYYYAPDAATLLCIYQHIGQITPC